MWLLTYMLIDAALVLILVGVITALVGVVASRKK
jgi:hypothetical protein